MDIRNSGLFTLSLNSKEIRLIGLSLSGASLRGADAAEARELNLRILHRRQQILEEELALLRRASELAEQVAPPEEPQGI